MTKEEYIDKYMPEVLWGTDEGYKKKMLSALRSVLRGELMNFRDRHNRTHFMTIDIDEIDEFLNNNQ